MATEEAVGTDPARMFAQVNPKSAIRRRVDWGVRIIAVLIVGAAALYLYDAQVAPRVNKLAAPAAVSVAAQPGLPSGYSQTAFDRTVKSDLAGAPFRISGIASVSCVMPNSWVPGKTFTCYVYDSSNTELGTATGTVVPTLPNYAFNANLVWTPDP
jgi:hypothetical protein